MLTTTRTSSIVPSRRLGSAPKLPKRPLVSHLPPPRAPTHRVLSSFSPSFVLRLSLKQQKIFSIVPLTHFSPHQYYPHPFPLRRLRRLIRVYFSSSARSPASERCAAPANLLSEMGYDAMANHASSPAVAREAKKKRVRGVWGARFGLRYSRLDGLAC
jgi:hypothetical protein